MGGQIINVSHLQPTRRVKRPMCWPVKCFGCLETLTRVKSGSEQNVLIRQANHELSIFNEASKVALHVCVFKQKFSLSFLAMRCSVLSSCHTRKIFVKIYDVRYDLKTTTLYMHLDPVPKFLATLRRFLNKSYIKQNTRLDVKMKTCLYTSHSSFSFFLSHLYLNMWFFNTQRCV